MSAKQDRTAPRTAADIERKYDLGQLGGMDKQTVAISQLTQMVAQFIATTNAQFAKLEKMVTGIIGALHKKGDVFYTAVGYTLENFDMETETLCVIETITKGGQAVTEMQTAGTYYISFYGWADTDIKGTLPITLSSDLATKLSVGDMVYFTESTGGALCLAYVVDSSSGNQSSTEQGG